MSRFTFWTSKQTLTALNRVLKSLVLPELSQALQSQLYLLLLFQDNRQTGRRASSVVAFEESKSGGPGVRRLGRLPLHRECEGRRWDGPVVCRRARVDSFSAQVKRLGGAGKRVRRYRKHSQRWREPCRHHWSRSGSDARQARKHCEWTSWVCVTNVLCCRRNAANGTSVCWTTSLAPF